MIIPEPTPALAPPPTAPDQFVSAATFGSVISTVLSNNEGMDVAMATRITREAIAFVIVGARRPHLAMAPSRIVDEGWHAFLVHTEAYAELCEREGRFRAPQPGIRPGQLRPGHHGADPGCHPGGGLRGRPGTVAAADGRQPGDRSGELSALAQLFNQADEETGEALHQAR
ncbi:hypothetical protein [Kitasatospora sp. NBC_01300]|uniref:hypothetical protein n=1 Tax=Kitasatospora sp. NBC_01300 TaxID=2903574 RepID=UPI00352F44D0|nr:hypothetical protein OG556_03925 [Kitasatospora sp. NBC_01300]